MDQEIGHTEYRIVIVVPDGYINDGAVFFCDNAVNGEGNCDPLILFDAAVVVSVEISQLGILVQRILLDVKARRINVSKLNLD